MKHIVTDMEDHNEHVMFTLSILENYCFKSYFGDIEPIMPPLMELNKKSKIIHSTQMLSPTVH